MKSGDGFRSKPRDVDEEVRRSCSVENGDKLFVYGKMLFNSFVCVSVFPCKVRFSLTLLCEDPLLLTGPSAWVHEFRCCYVCISGFCYHFMTASKTLSGQDQ